MVTSARERGATAVLEGIGNRLWGFPPKLMAPIVRQLGPLRALRWFLWNMPRYERTLKAFGGLRTHLLSTTISVINGCPYCTFGHAYAFQLVHLRERGYLFPLDEHAIGQLRGSAPAVIRDHLVDALQRVNLHGEVPWLDRTIALTLGAEPRRDEPDDARLAHLVRMFGVLNSVGIASQTAPDEAHDPVNRNRPLKQLYAGLRAATSM
ncbi:MAG: hypothetical protein M3443_07070 [Actinomycetota bacterium]|nr:hypothetical protein [Actinomycetota bacterium]